MVKIQVSIEMLKDFEELRRYFEGITGPAKFNIAQIAEKENNDKLREFCKISGNTFQAINKLFKLPVMSYATENMEILKKNLQTLLTYIYQWIQYAEPIFKQYDKDNTVYARLKKEYSTFNEKYLN